MVFRANTPYSEIKIQFLDAEIIPLKLLKK